MLYYKIYLDLYITLYVYLRSQTKTAYLQKIYIYIYIFFIYLKNTRKISVQS